MGKVLLRNILIKFIQDVMSITPSRIALSNKNISLEAMSAKLDCSDQNCQTKPAPAAVCLLQYTACHLIMGRTEVNVRTFLKTFLQFHQLTVVLKFKSIQVSNLTVGRDSYFKTLVFWTEM